MKKAIFIFSIFLLSAVVVLFATDSYLRSFRATSQNTDIIVEWETTNESQIKNFDIERTSNNQNFQKIKTLDAKGKPSSYRFVDEEAFLKNGDNSTTQSAKIYSYRLKINFSDGNGNYSEQISVTHQTSGIRRTWGMIKELFR